MSKEPKNIDTLSIWDPRRPHDALPGLPPDADVETRPILRRCIAARVAVADLNRAADLLPNPAILIETLPLLEARASSEIENVVTTTDRLFRHARAGHDADPATREALRYREALLEGARSGAPLSTRTAEAICSRIKGIEMRVRRVPGTTIANASSGDVIYTPPEGEPKLRDLLADWERFVHADTPLDPLIRLAIAHYQFEAIHPFTDGNGRTGRILNSLFLVERGLLAQPILYASRYLIANKADYYRRLLGVTRDAAWEPWILFMLRGIEATATWTTTMIQSIRDLHDRTAERLREQLPKVYSRELVDVIFANPVCRIAQLVDARIAKRQTASTYLKALVDIDVLEEQSAGREKLFIHRELLALLTADG